ncbi:MAG: twin-arginine translocation signal domain-containing protein, partial [Rhodothermales bacterium]
MADRRIIDHECAACGGTGHEAHHRMWSRRDFLGTLLGATATVGLSLYRIPLYATAPRSRMASLLSLNPDRRLVLIQLKGGNDGFNTIVPVRNDLYYNLRPTLAIPANETVSLNAELGMHPSMAPLQNTWLSGQMAVIQGAGYPNASLSHFESTDIWTT